MGAWCRNELTQYGTVRNIFGFDNGSQIIGVGVPGTDQTVMSAYLFNGLTSAFDAVNLCLNNPQQWFFVAIQHVSGSSDYTVRWRQEGETSFSSYTMHGLTQMTNPNTFYVGTNGFGNACIDADIRSLFCQANTMSDADLLTVSQNLDTPPSGTNLHWLDFDSATNANVNGGTAGNWTITGTLSTSTTEPFSGTGAAIIGVNTPTYSTSGGTSISPSYSTLPAISAGDEILLVVAQKPSSANSGTVTTPSGYTLITSLTGAGGYGGTLADNTGNTNLFIYYKTAIGSETGTFTVTVGTNNMSCAQLILVRIPAGLTVSYGATTGSDTTGGNVSVTVDNDPNIISNDIALFAFNGSSALATYSAEAITTTGISYNVATEYGIFNTTTGNDVGGFIAAARALSGTSSAAPIFTATTGGTTTNARGPGILLRIRALVPGPAGYLFSTNAITFTIL